MRASNQRGQAEADKECEHAMFAHLTNERLLQHETHGH